AGRTQRQTEGLIGFFVNTLVLRADLSGDPSFLDLLEQVRETALGAYAHQDIPFEKLVADLQPERDLSRQPLFQVMFALQNVPQEPLTLPGLRLEPQERAQGTAKFDLFLQMTEREGELAASFEYATDLFEAETIERLAERFERLLAGVAADPQRPVSELELLGADERAQLVTEWNATRSAYPRAGVHELFAAQAARCPEAVAVVSGDTSLSYRALEERANRLGHHLQALGVGPEVVVGLCVERTADLVVGLLGILKAGGAYLPLDPAYPAERLGYMLSDARVAVVVTQASLEGLAAGPGRQQVVLDRDAAAIAARPSTAPRSGTGPDNLAYVIYTSGSTGTPKGVAGRHLSVTNRMAAQPTIDPYIETDVCCQKGSLGFVDSLFEILAPLAWGRPLVVVSSEATQDTARLLDEIGRRRITRLVTVPSLAHAMFRDADLRDALRHVTSWTLSGEAIGSDLSNRLSEALPNCTFINLYGSTEVAADATIHVLRGDKTCVPIGQPLPNVQAYVLDQDLSLCPIGVRGELYVGGDGLARGYLDAPALTAERFVPNPFRGGQRLYRTGDLARRSGDGSLEFLGRVDYQVKLRGYRIEPAEIETALLKHPNIKQAIVALRDAAANEGQLVAYVVGARRDLQAAELRSHLKALVPEYMIPAAFVVVDEFPMTVNGKVDRHSLPDLEDQPQEKSYVAPHGAVEEVLAYIWAEVLRLDRVSVDDNFFELGGHSLLATQVMARIREGFAVDLPVRVLFEETATVANLATLVETARLKKQGLHLPPLNVQARHDSIPLSFAQERLWFLDQLYSLGAAYNEAMAFRLQGALDIAVLERSLAELVRRHESLRTRFLLTDGRPRQIIDAPISVNLPLHDLTALPASERDAQAFRLLQDQAFEPFDLAQGPLFRALLLRLAPDRHLLAVTMHHIISDGWSSRSVLPRDLVALYAAEVQGRSPALPALPVQYADYALWQRGWLQGEVLERQLAYWRGQLAGAPEALDLPTDHPRPALPSFRGARHPFSLPPALAADLAALARSHKATLYMVLLAGFQALLGRWSGQRDVVVGSPIAGRTQRQTEGLIGFFVNTLVLRADLSGDPSFLDLLEQVRETA
ncbi:MAG: amino acid adenylation domain-containing protein, partial [Gemmatimonadota bacterium]